MPLTHRTLTPRSLAARRRNARQSSGPRTEAGKWRASRNGYKKKKSVGASPLPTMKALGENPADFARLVARLVRAYRPGNAAERLLVEDLATLRLRKQRNQQAQDGLTLKTLGALEREREERQQELAQESSSDFACLAAAMGLFHMEDSPAKFKELTRLFRIMREDVELGIFSADGEQLLRMIYGPSPSVRAARILGHYRELLSSGFKPLPQAGPSAVAAPSSEEDPDAPASLRAAYAQLRRALEEELTLLGQNYQRYLAERLPTALAVRRAALVPSEGDWARLARQEQFIDRQIENKTRLLLFTQWVRRKTTRGERAASKEADTKLVSV